MSADDICPLCSLVPDTKPRSWEQLKRYFGTMRALYKHWPDYHVHTGEKLEFRPQSETQLRKYLQVRVGGEYVSEKMIKPTSHDKKVQYHARVAIAAAFADPDDYVEIELKPEGILVRKSKSIAYPALGHKKFCCLYDAVKEVVYALTGLDAEQVLQEQKRAA